MKSYHFDLGNSNDGPIGMCARVRANGEDEAVALLQAALGEFMEVPPCDGGSAIDYIHVYFNGEAITKKDIDDWEDDG